MTYRKITREELENLYSHDGITRKELRYLLRVSPNQITNRLSDVFVNELNPFKYSEGHEFSIRGFIHSPPKKILNVFNSYHYQLLEDLGQYSIYILSSSPNHLETAIPMIIPKTLVGKEKISQAHFAEITGRLQNLNQFNPKAPEANYIISTEFNLLGFNELFSTTDPALKISDLHDMLKDRFNMPKSENDGILFWLMSSPEYEGRAGGNAFSPISPAEDKYKCDSRILDDFQNNLLMTQLPYFIKSPARKCDFDYISKVKTRLSYYQSDELIYKYEKNLDTARGFLQKRKPKKGSIESEINLSTTTLVLDKLNTRPLESFVRKPIIDSEMLKLTDLPILFSNNNLYIDDSETELFEFNMEISQLIYNSHLRIPMSQFEFTDTVSVVKDFMDKKMKSFPELRELMIQGIIFDLSPIGGLGEHLIRISNSILRSDIALSKGNALKKSENLFIEMVTKLFDEFEKPINEIYYQLEELRAERNQIKSHQLRNQINSILFELNNIYKDGWKYEEFEAELRKRSGHGKAKVKEIFQKLIDQKEVTERSPGLFWHITGFDRYT